MADPLDEYEKLRREIDATLADSSPPPAAPARRRGSAPARTGGGTGVGMEVVVAGGVAALVFVLFALLPFLRAGSGAVGAAIGAIIAAYLIPRVKR